MNESTARYIDVEIRVANVTKVYATSSAPVFALRDVSLEIHRAERVALLGKSGSGKSTLLNLLGGLDRPTKGHISIGGKNLDRLSARELAQFRSTSVGMIFQSFNLIPSRTALENVELPMVFMGVPKDQRRAAARRALDSVGLEARVHHRPAAMSGGENQRVSIARALVNQPDVLLADEPTGNLDTTTAREVMQLIVSYLDKQNATLVLVTHDEELAEEFTTRIVRLKDGGVMCD